MAPTQTMSLRSCLQALIGTTLTFSANVYSAAVPASADVVVVGAGLSGLSAAKNLIAGGKSVVILEARNRVGGKVLNRKLKNGGVTEVGAEFVGPTQDRVLATIAELGLQTYDTYNTGKGVLYRNGSREPYTPNPLLGGLPPLDLIAIPQIAIAQARLDSLASEIDVNAPWSHPKAKEWDAITFDTWLKLWAFLSDSRFILDIFSISIFAAEPEELSLLYVLTYIASAGNESNKGNINRLISVTDAAQEQRVVGGTGLIPEGLAAGIGSDNIVFNAAVSAVKKLSDGTYEVTSRAGKVKAKKVVIAMAPPLVKGITFTPALPNARTQLNNRMTMAHIGKGIAVYNTPFWRTGEGLSAQVISDSGIARVTFDNSPEDAAYGAVLGFIAGDDMRAWDSKTEAEVAAQVTADYVKYFGQQAASPVEVVVQRWDLEEWSKGGPVAVAPPKTLQPYGPALRAVVDGIHFAGTETAEYWTGYMDGAIRSGERVAREILAA